MKYFKCSLVGHPVKNLNLSKISPVKNLNPSNTSPVKNLNLSNTSPVKNLNLSKISPVKNLNLSKISNKFYKILNFLEFKNEFLLDKNNNSSFLGGINSELTKIHKNEFSGFFGIPETTFAR